MPLRVKCTLGQLQLLDTQPNFSLSFRCRDALWQAYYVKADKTIRNARQQARKHTAVKLDALTKELVVPLRQLVEGYRKQLRRLHPYESVVADLTVRALEKDGTASLSRALDEVKAV